MLKGKFTQDEWNLVSNSFEIVFDLVANVDGKIDKKEVEYLKQYHLMSDKLESELAKEIMNNFEFDETKNNHFNLSNSKTKLSKIGHIVDYSLEHHDAFIFKHTLISFAYYIASATRSFFSHSISEEEEEIINVVGFALEVSYREMKLSGEINKYLKHLSI